tara:strand:- start:3603 stop:4130 length:528 start_codon:yes stop_codon:yes gene_type:complete
MSSGTKKNIIVAAILIALATAAFGFMFYQISVQGKTLMAQVTALREEQAQEATYLRLQNIAVDSVEDREQLGSYFFRREADSIDFLNLVESIAPQLGVTLKTNDLSVVTDQVDQTDWIEVPFSFSGSRESVQNFIKVLENMPYVSKLMSVDIAARSSTNWNANVVMRVRLLDYDE